MGEETSTLEQIQQAAVQEFLDNGFRGASLRQIVKNAGVTTVEPHAAAIMGRFMQTQTEFAALPAAEQPSHMGVESSACVDWMMDYMYRHSVPVKLLLCRAEGTPYEHFVHNMVEVEVEATEQYIQVLRQLGRNVPELDHQLCHIIASGMFSAVFEVMVHDMPYDHAKQYIRQLREFYMAGWQKLMGE